MVYITGDTHGELARLTAGAARKLKKGDTLIVCGDFGFVWYGDRRDERALKRLSRLRYNVLFLDGVHENYTLLDAYPTVEFAGGTAQKLADNVYHLLRGEVYTIEGKTYFTFGGGEDEHERALRADYGTGFEREMPSAEEMTQGLARLRARNNRVDVVLTHYPSGKLNGYFAARKGADTRLSGVHVYLNQIEEQVTFSHWYFGSLHVDRPLASRHTAVFRDVLAAE